MPFDTVTLKRHLTAHLQDFACTVTLDGISTQGSKGGNVQTRDDFEAGFTDAATFPVWIGNVEVSTRPRLHTVCTVDGTEYRIARVEEYADGNGWRLDLVHPEQPNL